MNNAPTEIQHGIRRLRGKSQAWLVRGEDDLFYVAKFMDNPRGMQSLIEEWIAGSFLHQLGVSTPQLRLLRLTSETQQREQFHFLQGYRKVLVEGSLHLGSPLPCDPNEHAVWDFLPRALLKSVANLEDFAIAFVFDLWTQKTTLRQAAFIRSAASFRAYIIDHSSSFTPQVPEAFLPGLYVDESLYDALPMEELCVKAVGEIQRLPSVQSSVETIPREWLKSINPEILATLSRQYDRRKLILPEVLLSSLDLFRRRAKRREVPKRERRQCGPNALS